MIHNRMDSQEQSFPIDKFENITQGILQVHVVNLRYETLNAKKVTFPETPFRFHSNLWMKSLIQVLITVNLLVKGPQKTNYILQRLSVFRQILFIGVVGNNFPPRFAIDTHGIWRDRVPLYSVCVDRKTRREIFAGNAQTVAHVYEMCNTLPSK